MSIVEKNNESSIKGSGRVVMSRMISKMNGVRE